MTRYDRRVTDPRPDDGYGPVDSESLPSPAAGAAVDALVLLVASPPGPMPLRQIARSLGVPRSTMHRVLQTLEAKGMVAHVTSGYILGQRTLELVALAGAGSLPRLVRPVIRQLQEETGETVNVATPQLDYMLVVAVEESSAPLRVVSAVGTREAYHSSALGKAYLSALPDAGVEKILARIELVPATAKTLVESGLVLDEVRRAREREYAIDDEESMPGVRCVGVPIAGAHGHAMGALSISAPAQRLSTKSIPEMARLAGRAAAELSLLLGLAATEQPG
jgi:DNA-binding IclR family transcriptional regulator